MLTLNNKVAVITGGSSGIGLAIAKRFVAEGAYVFITSRRPSELDKAVAEIGKNVTAVPGDVAKLEDLDRLYSVVSSEGRKIDVVVANAGFVGMGPIATATPEFFDQTFDTNARGGFFTVQKALPLMNDGGSIILITSAGKDKASPGRSAYSGTKAALRSFVRTWTVELKDRGIRSNVLSPGATEAPILDGLFGSKEATETGKAQFVKATPLGRMGRPEEIAAAALFLASSEARDSRRLIINGIMRLSTTFPKPFPTRGNSFISRFATDFDERFAPFWACGESTLRRFAGENTKAVSQS